MSKDKIAELVRELKAMNRPLDATDYWVIVREDLDLNSAGEQWNIYNEEAMVGAIIDSMRNEAISTIHLYHYKDHVYPPQRKPKPK